MKFLVAISLTSHVYLIFSPKSRKAVMLVDHVDLSMSKFVLKAAIRELPS